MATSSGTKLAQEIHDEFLVCKICLESYKNPKSLNCLHTFCEECIENHVASESTYKKYSDYREFTCPLCRKRTQLPVGGVKKLADNFLVSSLSELVGRQRPSKFPFCDICKLLSGKHKDATSKCLDCAKLLCAGCVQLHKQTKVTSGHSLFDVETEKDIECHEHRDEAVRFYCEPCDTCICILCTFNEHRDHEITQFSDAVGKYKDNIRALLADCQGKIATFDAQMEALGQCEEMIRASEQSIHDTAIAFIQDIRAREKQTVEQLHNIYGSECMDYMDSKKELAVQVENLRSTCTLTEMVLSGKDIELLLLKKEVQDKLTALGDIDVKSLPETVQKKIRFVAGTVEFGQLLEADQPVVTTTDRSSGSAADMRRIMVARSTQTDPSSADGLPLTTAAHATTDSNGQTA
jgi:tripartite motif-containing protein 56